MASYTTVKKGSSGDQVKELQQLLNNSGYNVSVDGVFGSKTQAAVRDYQSKNNLAVDGIVGKNTWNSLTSTPDVLFGDADVLLEPEFAANNQATAGRQMSAAEWLAAYEGARPQYNQSQSVTDAYNMLLAYQGAAPGAYQSRYEAQIQGLLDQIMNREKFSYDFASDPMYKQYAERYQQQGKMAMMDTMANAAALSGGYSNSYAQAVGQQAYQSYLQGLNDVIPELRDMAYQMYQDEGNAMYSQVDLLRGLDNTEYNRYRDSVGDYYNKLGYYTDMYNNAAATDYNRFLDTVGAWESDRNYYYAKNQDDMAAAALESQKSGSSSSGRSSSSSKNTASKTSSGTNTQQNYINPDGGRALAIDVQDLVARGRVDEAANLIDYAHKSGIISMNEADTLANESGIEFNGDGTLSSSKTLTGDALRKYTDEKGAHNLSYLEHSMLMERGNQAVANTPKYGDYLSFLDYLEQRDKLKK